MISTGPAGDHEAPRLTPHSLDRHFGCGPETAVELHAPVGGLEAKLGAEDFGHERLVPLQRPVVELPSCSIGQELPRLQLGVEVGDRKLHGLPGVKRAAKGAALLCVARDHLQAALSHAEARARPVPPGWR